MLALIAGRGHLPDKVVAALGERPIICAMEGCLPDRLDPDLVFRLETLGTLLRILAERGVTGVCFCGAIDRPALDPAALDAETRPLVPIFMEALAKGDDGALRAAIHLFERAGFTIRAAHEIAPEIVARAGIPTQGKPRSTHRADADLGDRVLAEMGAADEGQACVIRQGRVLAREDRAGTDAMLAGLAGAAQDAPGTGAILFKGPKPEQDRRIDLPTIGPDTAKAAAEAGCDGIVIEAGGVIILDEPRVVAVLDAMNMFLWVRERP
ncbi:LpxI family protein [Aquicoccus porphyridii]|uniref:LpxI family protein n=1 Tax=Aquicoccus porphyridii TaxID=1852029 RepID=A0A5A9ZUM8_9RHOB|nr:UDP-2,3-diacylglucosamine diphosphatase LpxI [Aquicoccus porphyridii]KAA0921034.1 LpxI family protein [Aquicoccus porphyridii]RAI56430.1 LpxI family protein [Rhodobacteraceae bacterium AsT-22]